MNTVLVGVLAYVLLQFAVGAWVSRRIFTERDYIKAGAVISAILSRSTRCSCRAAPSSRTTS